MFTMVLLCLSMHKQARAQTCRRSNTYPC